MMRHKQPRLASITAAFGTSLLSVLAATLTFTTSAQAQERPGAPVRPLVVHPLNAGAYWIEGAGSNVDFIVGDKGVIVFDTTRSPDNARRAIAEIAKITPKPINYIVISHGDPDHVGGLPAFTPGTPIIAQENTWATIMVSAADANPSSAVYKALMPTFMPTELIADHKSVTVDGVRMEMMHVAPGHTNSDMFLYLPGKKIVFTGDIITLQLGKYPVIHLGGSSLGWMQTVRALLALDADVYVGGHGDTETKAMLRDQLREVEARRDQIKAMVYQSKTLDEIKTALGEVAPPAMPGAPPGGPHFPTFTETTYAEFAKGYPPSVPPWYNFGH